MKARILKRRKKAGSKDRMKEGIEKEISEQKGRTNGMPLCKIHIQNFLLKQQHESCSKNLK
jgi:hypothetical protein